MSEDYRYQVSVKFGEHDNAMLNVRANTPDELAGALAAVNELAGDIALAPEVLRATAAVSNQFPGTEVINSGANSAGAGAGQGAQAATAGPDYANCPHGARVKRSGGNGSDAWEGYFCPLPKTDTRRCKPVYPGR